MTNTNSQKGASSTTDDQAEAGRIAFENQAILDALSASQAVIQFETDGTIIDANENFCAAVGYDLSEIVGRHHRIFADPEYARSADYEQFWTDLRAGRCHIGDFQRFGKGGAEIWIRASYNVLRNEAGEIYKVIKYAQDITEAKKSEMKAAVLSSAMASSLTPSIQIDRDLVIVSANNATLDLVRNNYQHFKAQFPRADFENLIGTCIDDFHTEPTFQRKILGDPRNLPHKAEIEVGPLRFALNISASLNEDGEHVGSNLEWNDVTEQRRLEAQQVLCNQKLKDMSTEIQQGNLTARIDLEGLEGEFSALASGVNDMIEGILAPVNEISDVLTQVAAQDLRARVSGQYAGDLEAIKGSVNQALETLESTMIRVATSTVQVSSASGQIREGSQKVAEGASNQAASIEEISASLEEISSMTGQNADNAVQAKALADTANQSALNGNEQMIQMKAAIDAIKASSDETAKIVKTIDEISFQTNMLALNAAVEAARAGDAGKGFAVVAEEVRSLAQRSAEAAKTTAELIEGAGKNVDQGVAFTESVSTILDEINDGSGKVAELINEIAAASREQSEGVSQVSTAIDSMNRVTQENAANSEESSASASELDGQVSQLEQLISQFQLNMASAAPQAPRAVASAPAPSRPATVGSSSPAMAFPLDDDELGSF